MIRLTDAIPYTAAALLAVTFLASAGAVASRMLNFNYTYLSAASFAVYILIGYYVSPKCGFSAAILASIITGFYDATVGFKVSVFCKANFGLSEEDMKKITPSTTLTIMLFMAPLLALIGYAMS